MDFDKHYENQWAGKYWGNGGAVWAAWKIFFFGNPQGNGQWKLFPLLSTHYGATGKIPLKTFSDRFFWTPRFLWAAGWTALLTLWAVVYFDPADLSGDDLDVLSSACLVFKQRKRALYYAQLGLEKKDNEPYTEALLLMTIVGVVGLLSETGQRHISRVADLYETVCEGAVIYFNQCASGKTDMKKRHELRQYARVGRKMLRCFQESDKKYGSPESSVEVDKVREGVENLEQIIKTPVLSPEMRTRKNVI